MAIYPETVATVDAARALASTPLFAGLSAVDLARLVPELDEIEYGAGDTIFRQGDAGDGLYLIRRGSVGVSVGSSDQQRIVAVLDAPAYFGEMALLSDAPRSATILALRPLQVWRLPRERFDRLIERQPIILRQAAGEVTRRLNDTTQRLSASQDGLLAVAGAAFDALDEAAQDVLHVVAVAGTIDDTGLDVVLGREWSADRFGWLVRESGFFESRGAPASADSGSPGPYRLSNDGLRQLVLGRLEAAIGQDGRQRLERRVLLALMGSSAATPPELIALARSAQEWPVVREIAERHGAALLASSPAELEAALRALPTDDVWASPGLVWLLADACVAQGRADLAADVIKEAQQRGLSRVASGGPFALPADARSAVRSPESLRARARRLGARALGDASEFLMPSGLAGTMPFRCMLAFVLTAGVVMLAVGPPPTGLSPQGYRVLLGVGLTLSIGLLNVLPDFLLAVLTLVAWAATGTVPLGVSASGLASPAWFLLLGAFGVGVAVTRSGILFRLAVELTRRLPPNHAVRCFALAILGLLFTAGMPSTAGRLALASPLALDISDALRLPHRGPGAAALALSVFVGFGQMGTLFLTGSSATLVAYGLLPGAVQAQFSWGIWLLAALPTHLILFGLTMAFILLYFHTPPGPPSARETLLVQRDILGRPSKDEIVVLVVISLLLVGFVTEPWHGVNPAWLSLSALGALVLVGAVDEGSLKSGVNWSLLLYLGVVLGFGSVFEQVGLSQWLTGSLDGLTDMVGDSQTLFLLVIALASMAAGIVLRAGPSSAVLCLVLFPLGSSIGLNPWVVALTVLMATNLWLHPQQSVYYLVAYYGAGERGFTHSQARPLAFAYALFVVIAVLAAIPYWRWLGLIT